MGNNEKKEFIESTLIEGELIKIGNQGDDFYTYTDGVKCYQIPKIDSQLFSRFDLLYKVLKGRDFSIQILDYVRHENDFLISPFLKDSETLSSKMINELCLKSKKHILTTIGYFLAELHSLDISNIRYCSSNYRKKIENNFTSIKQFSKYLFYEMSEIDDHNYEDFLSSLLSISFNDSKECLILRDFHLGNLILKENKLFLCDLFHISIGSRYCDFIELYQQLCFEDFEFLCMSYNSKISCKIDISKIVDFCKL